MKRQDVSGASDCVNRKLRVNLIFPTVVRRTSRKDHVQKISATCSFQTLCFVFQCREGQVIPKHRVCFQQCFRTMLLRRAEYEVTDFSVLGHLTNRDEWRPAQVFGKHACYSAGLADSADSETMLPH